MPVKVTPTSLIGSIMTVAGVIGAAFAVDSYFVSEAEAADQMRETAQQVQEVAERQQFDRVQTDLELIAFQIDYLETKLEKDPDDKDIQKKLEYLKRRQATLEEYALQYENAK